MHDGGSQVDRETVTQEREYRQSLWCEIQKRSAQRNLTSVDLRELRVYGGAQGIWIDKDRTASFADDGVTVSVLHTGTSYDDDLSDDCILYHYPFTNRPTSRDQGEINATKNTAKLGLPIFVVTYPSPSSQYRNVHLAWINDWDDQSRLFLIAFGNNPPKAEEFNDSIPFNPTSDEPRRLSKQVSRSGQQKFKFHVFKRYGPKCAFCDMQVLETLDAAHLRPKAVRGSDDPRNGLVLCATHHRAFDAGYVGIHPENLTIETVVNGPTRANLGITKTDLCDLSNRPHSEALQWCWHNFSKPRN